MLVETLVITTKGYNHKKGCGTVCKAMQEDFHDCFALGVLDADPRPPKYLNEFKLVVEKQKVKLFKHKTHLKHHYLILHPPLEVWLMTQLVEKNITLLDYGLPSDIKQFKKACKVVSSVNDHRFKRLFRDLKNQNSEGINVLAKWISYLKEHTYNSDIQILQNL